MKKLVKNDTRSHSSLFWESTTKNNPKYTAQGLANNDVRIQLQKTKERAQKIYDLFNEIGVNKIKRIQSFTAVTLSSISQDPVTMLKILGHESG
ncbi:10865_t:CDS:1, partial [Gigaspora margarita]